MSPPGACRQSAGRILCGLGLLACGCLSSCGDYGPTLGLGLGIGSHGGIGLGAMVGTTLRHGAGSMSRQGYAEDEKLLRNLPGIITMADKFDANLVKEYASLGRLHLSANPLDRQTAALRAKAKLPEIIHWIRTLERCEKAVSRDVDFEVSYPSGRMRELLKQRQKVQARLGSLKYHQSWYKSLAS